MVFYSHQLLIPHGAEGVPGETGFRDIHFFQYENLLLSFLVCGTVFYGDTLSGDTYTAL